MTIGCNNKGFTAGKGRKIKALGISAAEGRFFCVFYPKTCYFIYLKMKLYFRGMRNIHFSGEAGVLPVMQGLEEPWRKKLGLLELAF